MIQFRDGPFMLVVSFHADIISLIQLSHDSRPHPAFWRVILGINVLYELAMVFLVFQDLDTARHMMTYIDSDLGRPLPEKNYAENCEFTLLNIWVRHTVSWLDVCG
jgi:phosphatidylserine synthase 2